ncbi:unnamed protein product [Leuciscus chuanchicus]
MPAPDPAAVFNRAKEGWASPVGHIMAVVNGLMEREDWEEAIQTPLGVLPGGSGNALAASVHHYSGLSDGIIHLIYVKAGISRRSLLRLFLAMEKGGHLSINCPHVVYVKVKALRLEPYSPKGIITVDGELVEYGPAKVLRQIWIRPGSGRLQENLGINTDTKISVDAILLMM